MTWHLIRTISGKEFEVSAELEAMGIETKVPTCVRSERMKGRRRRKDVIRPVLPCYIYASIPDGQHSAVKGTDHVIAGGVVPLNRRDIEDIARFERMAVKGYFNSEGIHGDLKPGQIMQVVGGIFAHLHFSFEAVRGERIAGRMGGRKVEFDAMDVDIA